VSNNEIHPMREKYVIVEGLVFAIEALNLLPIEHRPDNNITDMKWALDRLIGQDGNLELYQSVAHRRLEALIAHIKS
jgi:hypothetical protein